MNNPELRIIGGGELALIIGATEAPADEAAYDAAAAVFGNITKVEPLNESSSVEAWGMYKGVKILDDEIDTSFKAGYKLTCDEFDERAMRALYGAGAGEVDGVDANLTNYTPLSGANTLRGFARLKLFDARDPENPALIHKDFKCKLKMTTKPTFDGESYSSYELEVRTLGVVGKVQRRTAGVA